MNAGILLGFRWKMVFLCEYMVSSFFKIVFSISLISFQEISNRFVLLKKWTANQFGNNDYFLIIMTLRLN